jgi:hypothetical protein
VTPRKLKINKTKQQQHNATQTTQNNNNNKQTHGTVSDISFSLLPTDGGAGGPSGSQYGDAVGPSRSAASPRTEPQYGLPTDGGARGPSGSAAASSSSFGPPPPAPPPLQQALEGDTRRDPTDGGARGPSGSAAASSLELGPPPPAPPPLPQALEGDTRRDRKKSRDQLRAEARKLKQPIQESSR